jgi:hypothetical protein
MRESGRAISKCEPDHSFHPAMIDTRMVPTISERWDILEEGPMLKTSFIIAAAMCGCVLIGSVAAIAAPVTDADLRGKKICWNTGFTSSYNKDGSFDGNRSGHGTWRLNGDLLTVSAEHGSGASNISKDGSTFHSTRRASKSGTDIDAWGSYCN